MRLQLLSDLHFEFHADGGQSFVESMDPTGIDVLVLAGDIAVGEQIEQALGLFCRRYAAARVVYVHGNHEYYGAARQRVVEVTKAALRKHPNLVWLDADVEVIDGQRFLGGPLWFTRDRHAARLKRSMADFSEIPRFETWVYKENERMRALLQSELREGDVVVTHHLPSHRSVSPRFSGSPLNAFFVCNLEDLILERHPALWMHGHTHSSVDKSVGATRILCNPFGYAGWELNPEFRDRHVVDL